MSLYNYSYIINVKSLLSPTFEPKFGLNSFIFLYMLLISTLLYINNSIWSISFFYSNNFEPKNKIVNSNYFWKYMKNLKWIKNLKIILFYLWIGPFNVSGVNAIIFGWTF